mgnify:CR=1 FL=1
MSDAVDIAGVRLTSPETDAANERARVIGERGRADADAELEAIDRKLAADVEKLVADMDRIEASNLARSVLYREEDEGRPKALTAARDHRDRVRKPFEEWVRHGRYDEPGVTAPLADSGA